MNVDVPQTGHRQQVREGTPPEVSVLSQRVYSLHCFRDDGWVSRGISGAPHPTCRQLHRRVFFPPATIYYISNLEKGLESYNFIISFLSISSPSIFHLGHDFPI